MGTNDRKRNALIFSSKFGTIIFLLLMVVTFSALKPRAFASVGNFLNILNQSSLSALIACGLTAVVIVGEFDMSIGYVASISGVLVTGFMVNQGMRLGLAIVCTLLIAMALGFLNGIIVTKLKVSSVIATIGTGSGIILGLNYAYGNGKTIATGFDKMFTQMTLTRVFGIIPINIIYMAVILFILWVVINKTELGQRIQAVGGNATAARLSGIYVDRIKIIAFTMSSLCAGITGILLASVLGSGTSNAGDSYMMNSFAAVYLGSATLKDGEFHILGTFIGVLIIRVVFNGLAIFGVPTFFQYLAQGAILILAVSLSTVSREISKS